MKLNSVRGVSWLQHCHLVLVCSVEHLERGLGSVELGSVELELDEQPQQLEQQQEHLDKLEQL